MEDGVDYENEILSQSRNKSRVSKEREAEVNTTLLIKSQADFWESKRKIAEEQHKWARERHDFSMMIENLKKEKLLLEIEKLKNN